jgi:hypothetical protein
MVTRGPHVRWPKGLPGDADAIGAVEVGEHQDMEQFRVESSSERVETLAQDSLDVLQAHELTLAPRRRSSGFVRLERLVSP